MMKTWCIKEKEEVAFVASVREPFYHTPHGPGSSGTLTTYYVPL